MTDKSRTTQPTARRGAAHRVRHVLDEPASSPADARTLRLLLRESAQARAQADQANEANVANNTMLAALAHELRAPLAGILLYAQLLREGEVVELQDLKQIGDSLERAVKQQAQLLDQLLDDSRDTSHDATLERQSHDQSYGSGEEPALLRIGADRHGTWTLTFPPSSTSDRSGPELASQAATLSVRSSPTDS